MSVLLPAVAGVRVQLPAATLALQLSVPSPTVTLPVGVPPPEVTVNATAIPWPVTDGFGVWVVITVVVLAAPTVWLTAVEVLVVKFPSPG